MPKIIIIGGGAAGFFAAIRAAELLPHAQISIVERGQDVLQKVRISGGGRCNVTHACYDPRELTRNYPRGSKALLAPFMRFQPQHTVDWFAQHGVALHTEADGRMFPITNNSATIVNCLLGAANTLGIKIRTSTRVDALVPPSENNAQWQIKTPHELLYADAVMVAAGSSTAVWQMLADIGHRIVPPVPSLFTFNCKDVRLAGLAGLSMPQAQISIKGNKLTAQGAVLITHWGLSGPAVLRLSAWGARELHTQNYDFELQLNWLGSNNTVATILVQLQSDKLLFAKKQMTTNAQYGIPSRLWQRLCAAANINDTLKWADANKQHLQALATQLCAAPFIVNGKSTFKDEFVTCGGVHLDDLNFKTMESKLHPRLYMAGEILDIDAITGGFNFQAAWTCGYITGEAIGALFTTSQA
jgi:predicted Rossmann fold flavoprotein